MYYNKTMEEIFSEFNTSYNGITPDEAKNRLKKYGPNSLKEEKAQPIWRLILHQFTSPLIYILLIAALFTLFIQHYIDTIVILIVVIINAIVGFLQEYKAEKAILALKKLTTPKAFVIRQCHEDHIDSSEVVPGDIVTLSAGNKVPADVRLFEVKELEIDESMLTGESTSVSKETKFIDKTNISLPDQKNIAFMGTVIIQGRAKGIVIKTGIHTELGKISREVKSTIKETSPLQKKFEVLSNKIGFISLGLAFLVILLGLIQQIPIDEIILFAISMTVAIIPEGLPIATTITMAVGLKRMADKNAIIRKLTSVETLGSCNYICSDKTGTITENQMTVTFAYANGKEFEFTGVGYNPKGEILCNKQKVQQDFDLYKLLLTGLLCNTSQLYEENNEWKIEGDPTEGALIVAAQKYGINTEKTEFEYKLVDEIPFSSQRQYMATMYSHNDRNIIFVKGAPEKILEFMSDKEKAELSDQYLKMAESGLRVLGFGIKHINSFSNGINLEKESTTNLEFVGFTGIIDPPKQSALGAIKSAQNAGIKVVMLTGDHKVTAASIAKQIGIYKPGDLITTGQELNKCQDGFLDRCAEKISVYARVSPHHKLKIVDALQKKRFYRCSNRRWNKRCSST